MMKRELDNAPAVAPKKFVPKIPPRKQSKAARPKAEPTEAKSDLIDKELLSKIAKNEHGSGRKPRAEEKSAPARVAFGQGNSFQLRSFGNSRSTVSGSKLEDGSDISVPTVKEYVEPWDYSHTYYPVTLPLRRPYSGDPEILDKEEFGEDATTVQATVPPSEELGLMVENRNPEMFLFQFPAVLPSPKQPTAIRPQAAAGDSGNKKPTSDTESKSKAACSLKDLPSGYVGKMLVYKSGKVKMKIGDALFDVSPGQSCAFAQDAAVINVKKNHCCVLGDLSKRAVVTPDVDALIESIEGL